MDERDSGSNKQTKIKQKRSESTDKERRKETKLARDLGYDYGKMTHNIKHTEKAKVEIGNNTMK